MPYAFVMERDDDESDWCFALSCEPVEYGDCCRKPKGKELSRKAMAEALDHDAENVNAHDFVGCHAKLLTLLERTVGKKEAGVVMRELGKERGLHGLDDVCSCRRDHS